MLYGLHHGISLPFSFLDVCSLLTPRTSIGDIEMVAALLGREFSVELLGYKFAERRGSPIELPGFVDIIIAFFFGLEGPVRKRTAGSFTVSGRN